MREGDERCKRRNILKGALEKIRFFRVCRKNLQGAELLFFLNSFTLCDKYLVVLWSCSQRILTSSIKALYLQLYDIKPILDLLHHLHPFLISSLKSFNLIIYALI